jgi:hypothetical protein
MKIELKPYAKLVKHRPYRLNPRFKEKVKKEIDRMLAAGLIFLVDEDEWISLIIIKSKKGTHDIRAFVDYSSLKLDYVHNPFPTPFSDEVLNQLVGNEAYISIMVSWVIIKSELWKRKIRRTLLLPIGVIFLIMEILFPLGCKKTTMVNVLPL